MWSSLHCKMLQQLRQLVQAEKPWTSSCHVHNICVTGQDENRILRRCHRGIGQAGDLPQKCPDFFGHNCIEYKHKLRVKTRHIECLRSCVKNCSQLPLEGFEQPTPEGCRHMQEWLTGQVSEKTHAYSACLQLNRQPLDISCMLHDLSLTLPRPPHDVKQGVVLTTNMPCVASGRR